MKLSKIVKANSSSNSKLKRIHFLSRNKNLIDKYGFGISSAISLYFLTLLKYRRTR